MDALQTTREKDGSIENTFPEIAFYHVIETIFKFLNIKDLCRAAAVCKTWYTEANKEKARRNAVQVLVVEVEDLEHDDYCDDDCPPKYLQNRWHLSEGLSAIPNLLLLFFDGSTVDYNHPNPSNIYYTTYHYQLDQICHGVACMTVLGVSFDYTELLGQTNLGAALSIPSTSALEVEAFVPNDDIMFTLIEQHSLLIFAEHDASKFVSTKDDHNCYIYFFNQGTTTVDREIERYFLEFSNWICKLSKPGTYTLWGAETDQITTDIDSYSTREEAWLIAIRLSGPAMMSFSIVLQTNLSIAETKDKLLNFKKGMQLKTNTVALAIVPSDENESSEQRLTKIEVFKQVFPKIPLISVYIKNEFRQLGINSMDCKAQPTIWHKNSISYLVITTR